MSLVNFGNIAFKTLINVGKLAFMSLINFENKTFMSLINFEKKTFMCLINFEKLTDWLWIEGPLPEPVVEAVDKVNDTNSNLFNFDMKLRILKVFFFSS